MKYYFDKIRGFGFVGVMFTNYSIKFIIMKTKRQIWIIILFFTIAVLIPESHLNAQSQRKLAKIFIHKIIKEHPDITIVKPDFIYKYNYNFNSDEMPLASESQRNAASLKHSKFLKKINDSTFLSHFISGYKMELEKYGFSPSVVSQNPKNSLSGYVADIAQVELDEQYYPYSDSAIYNNNLYVFQKKLNALDVNMWFKIYKAKQIVTKVPVLFTENLLIDDFFDGHFVLSSNEDRLNYFYKRVPLTVKKIYKDVENLGRIYAEYTVDYLLNSFIRKNIPKDINIKEWHYNPYSRLIYSGKEQGFEIVH